MIFSGLSSPCFRFILVLWNVICGFCNCQYPYILQSSQLGISKNLCVFGIWTVFVVTVVPEYLFCSKLGDLLLHSTITLGLVHVVTHYWLGLLLFDNQNSPVQLASRSVYIEERRANSMGATRGGSMLQTQFSFLQLLFFLLDSIMRMIS